MSCLDIRYFQAETIQQALEMVRQELGSKALIVSTRPVFETNHDGSVAQRYIKVQARIEEESALPEESTPELRSASESEAMDLVNQAESYIESLYRKEQAEIRQQALDAKRQWLEEPERFMPAEILQGLIQSGLNLEEARKLLRLVGQQESTPAYVNGIHKQLKEIVAFHTLNLTSLAKQRADQQILVAIGRSGSGKSTLLSNLATQYQLREEMSVGLIELTGSTRHQHSWVHQHLRNLGIRTLQAGNRGELSDALQHLHDCQIVVIDTPGVSAGQQQQLSLLTSCLNQIPNSHFLITHDVNGRSEATIELVRMLQVSGHLSLALTKTDEQQSCGHLVSLFQQIQLPVTLLSHSAALADGFTLMTDIVYEQLILRMTNLYSEEPPKDSVDAQDAFTLSFNPM